MSLVERSEQCAALRTEIDTIVEQPAYDLEQVAQLLAKLNIHLSESPSPRDDIEQFALFLQQNLDWLQVTMAKLSAEKDAVADNMMQIKKGYRARHSYGQHN
ncbi:hypothetical protein SAMN06297280_3030 [Arsukibacterium tuosuense]|uniref:Flagellar protein FliT n=1 Tax=Arsukibacterium tuosuense TaxID=1323745 RepID=A0A285J9D5_9GAMM|nr:hypothetical protein [Arsukibacterium tuosuense]SNY55976.1 hypothetical protein SAMN06297280_3030 [Arsukibacterium tuosuense]